MIELRRGDGSQVAIEHNRQWEFLSKENTLSILIDTSSVVVQTSAYTRFEDFESSVKIALATLAEHTKPVLVHRIGLRYVDLIQPGDKKSFRDYVQAPLLGVDLSAHGSRLAHVVESLIQTSDQTKLIARYTEASSGLAFPVDMLPVSLSLRHDPRRPKPFALLDTDHYMEQTFDFDTDAILEKLGALHDGLDQIFRQLVTPLALEEWK